MLGIFVLSLFIVCFCRYSSDDIVNPQQYPQHSFPSSRHPDDYRVNGQLLPSYVYDPEGYLKPGTYKNVNSKLASLRKDTDVEVCVVIVDRIKERETPYQFTKSVFDRFGVGDKIDNNGVVLGLMIENRKLEFVHGKGMNKLLRNSQYDEIIEAMGDYLRNGKVDDAVVYAVNAIQYRVEHPPSFLLRVLYFFQDHIIFDIFLLIGLIALCSFVANKIGARRVLERENRYRAEMDGIRQHLENPSSSTRPIFSPICPICMERFSEKHIQRNEAYARILEKRRLEQLHPDVPTGIEEEQIDWNIDTGVETFSKCGHQFHRSCISNWLQTSDTCPICRCAHPRRPRDARDQQPPRGRGSSGGDDDEGCFSSSSSSSSSSSWFGGFGQQQYQYQQQYRPAPLTMGDLGIMMMRDPYRPYYNGWSYYNQWQMMRSFGRTMAAVAMESASQSGGSSGHHFGGGSSSGGGHRGGSW